MLSVFVRSEKAGQQATGLLTRAILNFELLLVFGSELSAAQILGELLSQQPRVLCFLLFPG